MEKLGGSVALYAFLIELTFLPGRERLKGYEVRSLSKPRIRVVEDDASTRAYLADSGECALLRLAQGPVAVQQPADTFLEVARRAAHKGEAIDRRIAPILWGTWAR